jgi:hypothetical protein
MKTTNLLLIPIVLSEFSAPAQGILDQSFFPTNSNILAENFDADLGQTFTVGRAGYLTEVDAYLAPTAPDPNGVITWELRSTLAGVPVGTLAGLLATGTIPYANLPSGRYAMQPFAIPYGAVLVTSGERLAIILSSTTDSFDWEGKSGNPYPGGSYLVRRSSNYTLAPDVDVGFQTFVTVPEPSTVWLLVLFGAGVVICHGNIRRP